MLTQDVVNQFRHQTILVAGDTYVDREIYGDVLRLAPEAPVPVVKVKSKRFVPGGAANVAKNIALLGGKAILCGSFEKKKCRTIFGRDCLQKTSVSCRWLTGRGFACRNDIGSSEPTSSSCRCSVRRVIPQRLLSGA